MQQSAQMIVPSFPPTNITTEQIQKFLDENKKLIMAILENQNLGKLAECAQYQALLQKNLMYLAAIADTQPQPPRAMTPPQAMATHQSSMQPPSSFFMQQAMGMAQQVFHPLQFGSPQQQTMQGHIGIRPVGLQQQHQMHHTETVLGAPNSGPTDAYDREGKHDATNASQSGQCGSLSN